MKRFSEEFWHGLFFQVFCGAIFVLFLWGTVWTDHAQDKPAPPLALPARVPPFALQAEPPKAETPAPGVPKTYEPTEVELLRLQLLEKDAELSQVALAQASANWQKATSDFNAQVETIKKAHGWPEDVHLDAVTYGKTKELKFVEAVPAPAPKFPRVPKAQAEEKKP